MSNQETTSQCLRFLSVFLIVPCLLLSCGDGWDAYKDLYNQEQGPPPGEPWVGDETVWVKLGETEIETPLAGIVTTDFDGSGAVLLSDLVIASGITATPEALEAFRYNFIAMDPPPNPRYNLLVKRYNDVSLLPNWENMQHGFLYIYQGWDLRTGWDPEEQPWGSALSAYNVKYMNGGTIELLTHP